MVWERFALAIPTMFGRAATLLHGTGSMRREVIR
jgi:hypothetical protein